MPSPLAPREPGQPAIAGDGFPPGDSLVYDPNGNPVWWKNRTTAGYDSLTWDAESRLIRLRRYASGGSLQLDVHYAQAIRTRSVSRRTHDSGSDREERPAQKRPDWLDDSFGRTAAVLLGLYGLSLPIALAIAQLVSPHSLLISVLFALIIVMDLSVGGMHRAIRRPSRSIWAAVVLGYVVMVTIVVILMAF